MPTPNATPPSLSKKTDIVFGVYHLADHHNAVEAADPVEVSESV